MITLLNDMCYDSHKYIPFQYFTNINIQLYSWDYCECKYILFIWKSNIWNSYALQEFVAIFKGFAQNPILLLKRAFFSQLENNKLGR